MFNNLLFTYVLSILSLSASGCYQIIFIICGQIFVNIRIDGGNDERLTLVGIQSLQVIVIQRQRILLRNLLNVWTLGLSITMIHRAQSNQLRSSVAVIHWSGSIQLGSSVAVISCLALLQPLHQLAAWPRPITAGQAVPGAGHGPHHCPRGQCPHYRLVGGHSLSRKVVHHQILSGRVLSQKVLSWRSQRFIGGRGSDVFAQRWPARALLSRRKGSACKCLSWPRGWSRSGGGSEDNLGGRLARHHRGHDLRHSWSEGRMMEPSLTLYTILLLLEPGRGSVPVARAHIRLPSPIRICCSLGWAWGAGAVGLGARALYTGAVPWTPEMEQTKVTRSHSG